MKVSDPGTRAISERVELLTVSIQDSSLEPALLVARIVIVCGLPVTVGLAQLTTPVVPLMVMLIGLATSDQVTGCVPLLNDGVGPV